MTEITDVDGVGPSTADDLAEHGFETSEDIAAAEPDDLSDVDGVGPSTAEMMIESARGLSDGGTATVDATATAGTLEDGDKDDDTIAEAVEETPEKMAADYAVKVATPDALVRIARDESPATISGRLAITDGRGTVHTSYEPNPDGGIEGTFAVDGDVFTFQMPHITLHYDDTTINLDANGEVIRVTGGI